MSRKTQCNNLQDSNLKRYRSNIVGGRDEIEKKRLESTTSSETDVRHMGVNWPVNNT